MKPLRILVADDHELVRRGICTILEAEPSWMICGEAATGHEALQKALELKPDVITLDVGLPDMNGLDLMRHIRRRLPARFVIVSMHHSEQLAREAIAAGADGYVIKADSGQALADAIRMILAQRTYISEGVRRGPDVGSAQTPGALTPRELQVLQLLARGKANKEIASSLGISTKTAETHRARIMSKLGLHSITALVRYAIRNQIIEP